MASDGDSHEENKAPSDELLSEHVSEEEKHDGHSNAGLEDGAKSTDTQGSPPQPQKASPGPPPNGGTTAWLQVLGAWMLFLNTWGLLNTFGVYQTYYESGQLFHSTSSNIAWIGSIQAFMVLLVGAFAGPIFDRGYVRLLLLLGTFGVVFGHMMLSLCHSFWQVILAQGFVMGTGSGLLFVPSVAILPSYFSGRLGMAMGIAASGSSTGGIIYPIMLYRLSKTIGFPWSVRIIGFTALATLLIPIFAMKTRGRPAQVRALVDWTAFTDTPFATFVFGCFLGFIGLNIGLIYTSFFGQSTGFTSPSLSFYLVPILNAASVFGRTLPNIISDKIGPLNVITPSALIVGIVSLCNIAVTGTAGIVVTTVFFGFFSGVFIALPTVCFVQLTWDKSKLGTRIGQAFAFVGLGILAGGPGGGAILQRNASELDWTGLWTYGGVSYVATFLVFLLVRYMQVGFRLFVKV